MPANRLVDLRVLFVLLTMSAAATSASAAPCTGDDCTEWVTVGRQGGRVLVYRSFPLEAASPAITRAVIVVHGGSAGAAGHFRAGLEAARLAGALEDTLILAPRIPSNDNYVCMDAIAEQEINWGCQANNGWPAGGTARGDPAVTSYDVADALLVQLARKTVFPNLQAIVVAGHSAGGQYVVRYAMANQVHETLGVRVQYVVSNPAHYAYPDPVRADETGMDVPADVSRRGCKIYDDWPYGLQDRVGYSARLPEKTLGTQLASRPVTYLLGEQDTLTSGGLDTTCAAMAQGPNRLRRGQAFAAHMNRTYRAGHAVVVVPGCGHNARCMFTAPGALPVLFPGSRGAR
jgi:pimeloyl-ACP methyl ester carboxylesterase